MNHIWQRTNNELGSRKGIMISSTYVCKRCLLKRERILTMGAFYSRSGILFNKEMPDCIDWEIENSKTID